MYIAALGNETQGERRENTSGRLELPLLLCPMHFDFALGTEVLLTLESFNEPATMNSPRSGIQTQQRLTALRGKEVGQ